MIKKTLTWNKVHMQQKIGINQNERLKLNLHDRRNWLIQIEEFVETINLTVSVFQSDDQKEKTLR